MARREVTASRGKQPSRARNKSARGKTSTQKAGPQTEQRAGDVQGLSAFDKFNRALDLLGQGRMSDLQDPYLQLSSWYSGVQVISMSMQRAPFVPWMTGERSGEITSGPLYDLTKQPNTAQTWDQFLGQAIVHMHGPKGAAYMHKKGKRSIGLPEEIRLIDPQRVHAAVSSEDTMELRGWNIDRGPNGEPPQEIRGDDKDDIIPIYLAAHPTDPYQSVSPQIPGQLDLDTERMAALYTASTLASGGSPGLLFSFLGDSDWDEEQGRAVEEKLKQKYGTHDGYRMAAVSGDWKVQNLGMRPRDMEFTQWRSAIINIIARLLGITPLLLAHYEGATGLSDAGLQVQERVNYRQKFIPLGSKIANAWQKGIVNPYNPAIEVLFDFSQIEALQEDFAAKLVAAQALAQLLIPLEQIDSLLDLGLDLSKIPWASDVLVPFGQVPASQMGVSTEDAAEGDALPTEPLAETSDSGAGALNGAQAKEALNIISQVRLGSIPKTTAVALLVAMNVPPQLASQMLADVKLAPPEQIADEAAAAKGERAVEGDPDEEVDPASVVETHSEDDENAPDVVIEGRTLKLSIKRRRKAAKDYQKAREKAVTRVKGKVKRAMMTHRSAVLRAFNEQAGTSLRAIMRAQNPDMTELQLHELTPEEVVARAPTELEEAEIQAILDAVDRGLIAATISPAVEQAMRQAVAAGEPTLEALGVAKADLTEYRKRLPALTKKYAAQTLQKGPATAAEEMVKRAVRKTIVDAIDEGKTVAQTAKSLRAMFNETMSDGRARVIAQTETGIAMNTAQFEHYSANGVEEIEWRARMIRTRESHEAMHGTRAKIGEEFGNGLKYPQEPGAPAAEVVECHCGVVPVARSRSEVQVEAAALEEIEGRGVQERDGSFYVMTDDGVALSRAFETREQAQQRFAAMESFRREGVGA